VTPLLVAAAVVAIVAGRRVTAGHYLEDQVLTDRRVVVVTRVGAAYGLALDDIESVELRGTRASFTAGGKTVALLGLERIARPVLDDPRRLHVVMRIEKDGRKIGAGDLAV